MKVEVGFFVFLWVLEGLWLFFMLWNVFLDLSFRVVDGIEDGCGLD